MKSGLTAEQLEMWIACNLERLEQQADYAEQLIRSSDDFRAGVRVGDIFSRVHEMMDTVRQWRGRQT